MRRLPLRSKIKKEKEDDPDWEGNDDEMTLSMTSTSGASDEQGGILLNLL